MSEDLVEIEAVEDEGAEILRLLRRPRHVVQHSDDVEAADVDLFGADDDAQVAQLLPDVDADAGDAELLTATDAVPGRLQLLLGRTVRVSGVRVPTAVRGPRLGGIFKVRDLETVATLFGRVFPAERVGRGRAQVELEDGIPVCCSIVLGRAQPAVAHHGREGDLPEGFLARPLPQLPHHSCNNSNQSINQLVHSFFLFNFIVI